MLGEMKDFADVQKEIKRLDESMRAMQQGNITKNALLNVTEIKKSAGVKYGSNEADTINLLIQQFNRLIKNIAGH